MDQITPNTKKNFTETPNHGNIHHAPEDVLRILQNIDEIRNLTIFEVRLYKHFTGPKRWAQYSLEMQYALNERFRQANEISGWWLHPSSVENIHHTSESIIRQLAQKDGDLPRFWLEYSPSIQQALIKKFNEFKIDFYIPN